MAKGYVLYNPLAGNGNSEADADLLRVVMEEELVYDDLTRIVNYAAFLSGLEKDDFLVIAGGDGTLHRFVNDTDGIDIAQEILYFPTGTGNDFALDTGHDALDNPFPVTEYLQALPSAEVKGRKYRFLNGVGFGVDGYCCQVGDELRKIPGKRVNYTAIAIRGILSRFQARNAKVTVDGKEYAYQNVWIAPTMNGRYYGGGMMAAPEQDRRSAEGKLSLVIFHDAGRMKALCTFPGIFKGKHVKHEKTVTVLTGHEITVAFDRPTPLQIDGETIPDVTRYTAKSARLSGKASG